MAEQPKTTSPPEPHQYTQVITYPHQAYNPGPFPPPGPPGTYPHPFLPFPHPSDDGSPNAVPPPPYVVAFGPPGVMYAYPPPQAQAFGGPPVSQGSSALSRPKRKQVKMACTNCANACKRCDDTRPCERCLKYGISDSCIDGQRKERKKGIKRGPYKRKNKDGSDAAPYASPGASTPVHPAVAQFPPEGYFPAVYYPPPGFISHPPDAQQQQQQQQQGAPPEGGPPPPPPSSIGPPNPQQPVFPYYIHAGHHYPPIPYPGMYHPQGTPIMTLGGAAPPGAAAVNAVPVQPQADQQQQPPTTMNPTAEAGKKADDSDGDDNGPAPAAPAPGATPAEPRESTTATTSTSKKRARHARNSNANGNANGDTGKVVKKSKVATATTAGLRNGTGAVNGVGVEKDVVGPLKELLILPPVESSNSEGGSDDSDSTV